jgi:DNA-binding transcriptional ArsR family regulator
VDKIKKGGRNMADLEFIAPEKTTTVTFEVAPAYNVVSSLILLNERLPGFAEWVSQTAEALPQDLLETNMLVASSATTFLEGQSWPSFPAFVDHLETLDAYEMRDREMRAILKNAASYLEDGDQALPTAQDLLADESRYLTFIEEVYSCKDHPYNEAHSRREYAYLIDPPARKALMISHLRKMWDEILAKEWEHHVPMLQACVEAFESLDTRGMSPEGIIQHVVDRQIPDEWEGLFEALKEVILIPSPHIGPYLLMISQTDTTARIIFGARMPKGAKVQSPALNRTELIARMSALANDTRLSILHLLSQEDELGSQDIMNRLDLSQSAASRHLQHLKATGYIVERTRGAAKYYRLNPDRIDDMFQALKEFLQ